MKKKEKLIDLVELATKLNLTERAYLTSLFQEVVLCLNTPFEYSKSGPDMGSLNNGSSGYVYHDELVKRCEYVEKYLNHFLVEFTAAAKERK